MMLADRKDIAIWIFEPRYFVTGGIRNIGYLCVRRFFLRSIFAARIPRSTLPSRSREKSGFGQYQEQFHRPG
jgi:hypothetical protein